MDVLSASSYDNKIAWYPNYFNHNFFFQYSICEGDSIYILNQWVNEPGTFEHTYTNSLGGDSIITVTLTNLPLPDNFNITGPVQVEEYSVQTYSVPENSNVGYTFEVQQGNILSTLDNSVEVQWGENSIGWIIVTATFPETGCQTKSYLPVTVGTGGINESLASKVKLYPNPAADVLYVESILPDLSVEISDPAGKAVLQSIDPVIDISSLKQGIYIVKVLDKHGLVIRIEKLIVY